MRHCGGSKGIDLPGIAQASVGAVHDAGAPSAPPDPAAIEESSAIPAAAYQDHVCTSPIVCQRGPCPASFSFR